MTSLDPNTTLEIPGLVVGQRLGEGGFAQVYAARPVADGRDVAVKIAIRKQDARFDREISALRRVGCEVAPELFASGALPDGRPFIVMELVHGVPLSQWLSKERRQTLDRKLRLVATIARAVDTVHARGICHRDIKPANVLVHAAVKHPDPSIRLIDFGLARPLDATETLEPMNTEITADGARVGTVSHMAPEQCEGRRVDARADIYALGVILFEAIVGRPPFEGARAAILAAHSSRRPPVPSRLAGTPAALDTIVARCLEKRPEDRYQNAADIA